MTENIKFVSVSMRDGTKLSGVGRLEETPFAVTIYDNDGSYTVVPMQAISYYDVYDSEEEDE